MALAFRAVLVSRASVNDRMVRQQLDIDGCEVHVQANVLAFGDRVVCIEQRAHVLSQLTDVSRHRSVVVGMEERSKPVTVEARRLDPRIRLFAGLLFVAAIELQRCKQPRNYAGLRLQKLVEHGDRARDATRTAACAIGETQQTDDVGAIAMKTDVAAGAVKPHQRISRSVAGIDHVSEQIPLWILKTGNTQVLTERPEEPFRLVLGPSRDRYTRDHDKASPLGKLRAPLSDSGGKGRERKIVCAEVDRRALAAHRMIECDLD